MGVGILARKKEEALEEIVMDSWPIFFSMSEETLDLNVLMIYSIYYVLLYYYI